MDSPSRLLVTATLFLSACASSPEPSVSPVWDEIRAANKALEDRMKANDLAGVAALYADDAVLLGPGGFQVTGRDAIDEYWAGFGRGIDWKLEIHSLEGEEGLVCQRGTSHLTYERNGEERTSVVEFFVVWERQPEGAYRVKVDAYW